ncbi:MAG: RNA polymerase sigma factor [Alphaproteobacteria bacterium]|nr:RNA polymerase sigma factor [Alphaproteobacteria bacterium]
MLLLQKHPLLPTSRMGWVSDDRAAWLASHILPHEPALRAWLRHKRVVDLDVDDIVQETYARIAALDIVSNIREPKRYLFQTAYSIIAAHFRRLRVVSISATADLDQLSLMAPEASPEQELIYRDELRELGAALASLPSACRQAFTLRRISGLSQRETAQEMHISEKTVEKYMAKSVHLLMETFGRGGKVTSHASRKQKELIAPYDKTEEPGG